MSTPCFDTVILSDLHLGSEVSRARAALETLKAASFRRLILLGDIFCDLNFRRLKKEHWQFLSYIRKLSNPKRGVEVVWVEGNHDYGLAQVMSHLVGIPVYQEYEWDYRGIRHLAIHGHQFDRFLVNNQAVTNLFITIHEFLQRFSFTRQCIVGFLERFDTIWLRLSDKVAKHALEYGKARSAQRVFCGHTHEAMHLSSGGVEYYNTGSWTQDDATYVTIDEEGVTIHALERGINDHHPGTERGEIDSEPAVLTGAARLREDVEYKGVCR
jgi:UDP-2,3-diacylglucosamine pyrophosphatase LpxH